MYRSQLFTMSSLLRMLEWYLLYVRILGAYGPSLSSRVKPHSRKTQTMRNISYMGTYDRRLKTLERYIRLPHFSESMKQNHEIQPQKSTNEPRNIRDVTLHTAVLQQSATRSLGINSDVNKTHTNTIKRVPGIHIFSEIWHRYDSLQSTW